MQRGTVKGRAGHEKKKKTRSSTYDFHDRVSQVIYYLVSEGTMMAKPVSGRKRGFQVNGD